MSQIYKVYVKNKEVIFRKEETISFMNNSFSFTKLPEPNEIENIIREFEIDATHSTLELIYTNPNDLFNVFASCYKLISAAGGIVRNNSGDILFIFRNGVWDLPKGKTEKNETHEQSALREVMEETGLTALSIKTNLPCTFHKYTMNNSDILKKTHWFEMIAEKNEKLIPQTKEGITDIKWINCNDTEAILKNSYLSISDLVFDYLKLSKP